MWVVVAAWVLCLASLSLPWPGYTLIVLLCCVAFFELASPAAWVATARGGGGNNPAAAGRTPSTIEEMSDTRKAAAAVAGPPPPPPAAAAEATAVASYAGRSPSVAFAGVIRYLASHLRRRGGGEIEEVATTQVGSGDDGDDDHALGKEQQEQSKTAKVSSRGMLRHVCVGTKYNVEPLSISDRVVGIQTLLVKGRHPACVRCDPPLKEAALSFGTLEPQPGRPSARP